MTEHPRTCDGCDRVIGPDESYLRSGERTLCDECRDADR